MSNSIFTNYLIGIVISTLLLSPTIIQAQTLEEVVVTAQRREQSMQEVPIAIEAFTGEAISRQGFRDMVQVSNFSTTLNVDAGVTSSVSVRGFGTAGPNLTMEQAVPTFVDGIHYGRGTQIQSPFLDVQQVEILKGPQPVYFGQNATAGAINIRTRRPTPEWEANISADRGSQGRMTLEGGVGGPLTDTLGIRIVGKSDESGGYIRDVLTEDMVGAYESLVGRVTLQWTPNDQLTVVAKYEQGKMDRDINPVALCIAGGGRTSVFRNFNGAPLGDSASLYAPAPIGTGDQWGVPTIPLDENCFTELGVSKGGPYLPPPDFIRDRFVAFGHLDIMDAANGVVQQAATSPSINGYDTYSNQTAMLDVAYELENGHIINWLSAFNYYDRDTNNSTIDSHIVNDLKSRQEIFDQHSMELRLSSPTGGMFEWSTGLFWQQHDYDIDSMTPRANVRRGLSFYVASEDTEWKSAFATVTFNFLDNRASLDIGGRYSHTNKTTPIEGWGSMWMFDVEPVSVGLRGPDHPPGTPHRVSYSYYKVDPNQNFAYLKPGVDPNNLWAFPWLGRSQRITPVEWIGLPSVGATEMDNCNRENTTTRCQSPSFLIESTDKEIDPQITLRYRPTDNISLYAKWAQAFKAGGADTGSTSLSANEEEATFGPENAESFEVGMKGTAFNNRMRYDLTLFQLEITDLQVSSATPDPSNPNLNINAGAQRVRGLEFNTVYAVNEQWRVGLSGSLLDGEMSEFFGAGCTAAELVGAPGSGCDPVTQRIDRTGMQAPKSPDYKFVLNTDYWMPILNDNFKLDVDVMAYISDSYITDVSGFSRNIMMNKHGDLNFSVGLGDMNDSWRLSAYARNLFEARPSYNPEYDPPANPAGGPGSQTIGQGIVSTPLSSNNFMTYGLKLDYYFR
jgi:iron complex outermembrane receptor protein